MSFHKPDLCNVNTYFDNRGCFSELFTTKDGFEIAQINYSKSCKNTIRGLHFNIKNPQAKQVRVLQGSILDVIVDLRDGSPTYGLLVSYILTPAHKLFIPEGYAHGFQALEDDTMVCYAVNRPYDPVYDRGLSPMSDNLKETWKPTEKGGQYVISEKDLNWPVIIFNKTHYKYDPFQLFGCCTISEGE